MKTKLCKPILIDDEENIYKDELSLFDDKLIINSKLKSSSDTKQIILVSLNKDDEIKGGDLITDGNSIIIAPNIDGFIGFRKVIATQDQLPPKYIQQFIEEYNDGKVKDIEIEMENLHTITPPPNKTFIKNTSHRPKLTNGFVTIVEKSLYNGWDNLSQEYIDVILHKKEHVPIPILYTEAEVSKIIDTIDDLYRPYHRNNILGWEWFNQNKKK